MSEAEFVQFGVSVCITRRLVVVVVVLCGMKKGCGIVRILLRWEAKIVDEDSFRGFGLFKCNRRDVFPRRVYTLVHRIYSAPGLFVVVVCYS